MDRIIEKDRVTGLRRIVMKASVVLVSLIGLLFLGTSGTFAQEEGLSKKFLDELSPNRSKGLGGMNTPPTTVVDGENRPSTTIHLEFKFNSDELTPDGVSVLRELGKAIQSATLKNYIFRIEGHTDGAGTDAYNLNLSRRRAVSVEDFLVKTFGLNPGQFEVIPLGKSKPIASNDTEQGRAMNRRVVIVNTLQSFDSRAELKPVIDVKVRYVRAKGERDLEEGETLTERDNYAVEFTPRTSAHVYIYQVDSNGNSQIVFPNEKYSQVSSAVEPGRLYRVPGLGNWFHLDENKGKEHIVIIGQKDEIKDPQAICDRMVGREEIKFAQTEVAQPNTHGPQREKGLGGATDRVLAIPPQTQLPPPQIIDMSKVFTWKRSFDHQ